MILSIESSCDDSSIAITQIDNFKLVFHEKISQNEHSQYGGVVPELAARLHTITLPLILSKCKQYFPNLKAIAVTNEPGLSVSLAEGVMMAKALSISLCLPLIAINHLQGHIYSPFIEKKAIFPLGVLLVSGGHTQVLDVKSHDEIKLLAQTLDDSFGESFDKVAKMLGFGYPGGEIIENLAKKGDEMAYEFTIPLQNSPKLAFSYSGLKNQVRLAIENLQNEQDKKNISASFQRVAVSHLLDKLNKIFKTHKFQNFAVVGGASANLYLKNRLEKLCKRYDLNLFTAQMKFCSDNAAMIGRCAIEAYRQKQFVKFEELEVKPKFRLYE